MQPERLRVRAERFHSRGCNFSHPRALVDLIVAQGYAGPVPLVAVCYEVGVDRQLRGAFPRAPRHLGLLYNRDDHFLVIRFDSLLTADAHPYKASLGLCGHRCRVRKKHWVAQASARVLSRLFFTQDRGQRADGLVAQGH